MNIKFVPIQTSQLKENELADRKDPYEIKNNKWKNNIHLWPVIFSL